MKSAQSTANIPFNEILAHARFAPSGDNIQPWLFVQKNDDTLMLYRRQPSHLPEDPPYFTTGTFVGLGAVLESVVIAARHFGFETRVEYNAQFHPVDDFIATLQFAAAQQSSDHSHEALFHSLPERRTYRFPCTKRALSDEHRDILRKEAEQMGAELHFVDGKENLLHFGRAWGFHDDFFWEHHVLRENLTKTIHAPRKANAEQSGMPIHTLGLKWATHFLLPTFQLARYTPLVWKLLRHQAKRTSLQLATNSAAFGFVFLPIAPVKKVFEEGWPAKDSVIGGRAMQRIWLRAHALGLVIQPAYAFVAMIDNEQNAALGEKFITANRSMLAFLRNRLPQVDEQTLVFAFRIGHPRAHQVPRSPRKDVGGIFSTK